MEKWLWKTVWICPKTDCEIMNNNDNDNDGDDDDDNDDDDDDDNNNNNNNNKGKVIPLQARCGPEGG